jgi:hypothetical protein
LHQVSAFSLRLSGKSLHLSGRIDNPIHAIIDTRKSVGFIILMQQYSARALEGAW